MTNPSNPPTLIHAAIEALKQLDRRAAVGLIKEDMKRAPLSGERWRSVGMLCDKIGEIDLAVEAARRYAATEPRTLERVLHYCSELATRGRLDECLEVINSLPASVQNHTAVIHLRATLATQLGSFETAEPLVRKTIEQAPLTGQNWLSLSVIKKFTPDDPDIVHMESLREQISAAPDISQATFYYALGKAYHDAKNFDRAFQAYSKGAEIKRRLEPFDAEGRDAFTRKLISQFTPENLSRLTPSKCVSNRPIFVTGLPRSGTTLVEQILTSHSAVSGGAELNLFRAALLPAGDFLMAGALAYQGRAGNDPDPWGSIANDYIDMLAQRFGKAGRIVDKTLNHSRFMGLLLHALPNAKVIWLKRDPEDTAISVFRNYFASQVPWSYSLDDIARYFRNDEALHAHWTQVFPDRILTVPYEELVTKPALWIGRILTHVNLAEEPAVYEPHRQDKRTVLTASVAQVREPISPAQVGAAKKYDREMQTFRAAYMP
ncbi:MAG: sulfotransferase [Pseudomonadota bacterium]|nr:sulfotransferase [Pseudomonadota bacterium]